MDLGRVGIWTSQLEYQPMSRAQEAVAELEQLGFGTVWVPEAMWRDPLVNAALLLGATRRIVVATGIASIRTRSAHAMQAAQKTLTEAFPERFLLGLGVSHAGTVERFRLGTYERPLSRMVAYLDEMDSGAYAAAAPRTPLRRVLAALGPRMLRLAAERGLGAHPYLVPVEHTVYAREILGAGPLLAPEVKVVIATDRDEARRLARKTVAPYLGIPNYAANLRRVGFSDDDLEGPSDRLVDALVAYGDVEQAAARVRAHLDAGADHVGVQVVPAERTALPLEEWRLLAPALL